MHGNEHPGYIRESDYHAALFFCACAIIALILIIIFKPKPAVNDEQISNAINSLEEAREIITNTEQYGGEYSYDDVCDTILDDVTDALAWLELNS